MITKYSELEKTIHIEFKNPQIIENAFVHRSFLNEHKDFYLPSNEKLEFLGDSVLSLVTSVYLFKHYPALKEGDYTEIKSAIVKTESLAEAAKKINLGKYLLLSHGEESGDGRGNKNILADCFEALIAAIFIDHSFEKAYNFIISYLFSDKLSLIINDQSYLSSKSKLQEVVQAKHKIIPSYKVLEQTGPEHNRTFKIGVYIKGKKYGEGIAPSKKEAEEKAAQIAFEKLDS